MRGGRWYQDFPSTFFCLTVPKNVVGEHFRVSLISGIEKFYVAKVYVNYFRFSVEIYMSRNAENFRRGESFSVS